MFDFPACLPLLLTRNVRVFCCQREPCEFHRQSLNKGHALSVVFMLPGGWNPAVTVTVKETTRWEQPIEDGKQLDRWSLSS